MLKLTLQLAKKREANMTIENFGATATSYLNTTSAYILHGAEQFKGKINQAGSYVLDSAKECEKKIKDNAIADTLLGGAVGYFGATFAYSLGVKASSHWEKGNAYKAVSLAALSISSATLAAWGACYGVRNALAERAS